MIYLDNAATTLHKPPQVEQAILEALHTAGNPGRGAHEPTLHAARIVLDTRENVLMVERGPFVEQEGGRFAWVVEGRSAVRRPVQTGVSSLGYVEIVSGLEEGERIVVSGSDQFGDAQRVAIN